MSENGGRFNFESFTGTLIPRTTEGKNLMEVSFVNGESTSFDAPADKAKSMSENCEDSGDGSGSTGGGGGSTDGGDGGTGDGYEGGDGGYNGGEGSTGGGSTGGDDGGGSSGYAGDGCYWYILEGGTLFIDCPVVEIGEDPVNMTKATTVCDPIDEVYDGDCMDEYCEPDPVGIIIDPADLDPCESDDQNIDKLSEQGILDALWKESFGDGDPLPQDERKEVGGWITENPDGSMAFQPFPNNLQSSICTIKNVPAPPSNAVAVIHTHPIASVTERIKVSSCVIKVLDKFGITDLGYREHVMQEGVIYKGRASDADLEYAKFHSIDSYFIDGEQIVKFYDGSTNKQTEDEYERCGY